VPRRKVRRVVWFVFMAVGSLGDAGSAGTIYDEEECEATKYDRH
jgi:hypothetical protein